MMRIRGDSPFSRFPVLPILLHSLGPDFRLRTGGGRLIPASPLNRPSQQVIELQLIDHVIIGSPAPGADQLLQLE